MKTYKTEFYPEICCEICNEIIHTHFDCPICQEKNVGTETYREIFIDDFFICQGCESIFKRVDFEEIRLITEEELKTFKEKKWF